MKIDMHLFLGYFNFHFSGRFAVDEELHSFIIACYDIPTSKIHGILKQMIVDTYMNDNMLYLYAVSSNKIKSTRPGVVENDRRQLTLDSSLQEIPTAAQLTAMQRTVRVLANELQSRKLSLATAISKAQENVSLSSLRKLKVSRNHEITVLKGIGKKKLQQLIEAGILTVRELVEYPGVPQPWIGNKESSKMFEKYRRSGVSLFAAWERAVRNLEKEVSELEEQLIVAEGNVLLEQSVNEQMESQGEVAEREPLPPLFSTLTDRNGYNARFLSEGRIEAILMTDFLNRKTVQVSKMMGLPSEVLKLDFHYKLPKKIQVYTGVGKCFNPYKCLATLQNENNQTVFFKCCAGAEAISEIDRGLRSLKERNRSSVKLIYVDNCCSVRKRLQDIFGTACHVKLDSFHWFQRWDTVLYDVNSEEAAVFRGLMRRAVKVCDDEEYQRGKEVAGAKLNRRLGGNVAPTHRQVMAEARAVIPPKDDLERNILAVLSYCYSNDAALELRKMQAEPPLEGTKFPNPFFKSMTYKLKDRKTVRDAILNLLEHV
jgi:hypothetical protein